MLCTYIRMCVPYDLSILHETFYSIAKLLVFERRGRRGGTYHGPFAKWI
jgi:hypothetical protein